MTDQQYRPYFSVIITTWNRAGLVTRALDSLLAQTEKDWEAIIVDDGSTDDTVHRISNFIRRDGRFRYFLQPHSGEAVSKNLGIQMAAGKFITFLDSDDEYARKHLSSRKQLIIQNPSARFFHGGVKIMGNPMVPDRFNPTRLISLTKCVIGGTFVIESNTLRSLEGFRDEVLGADAELFDRAKQAGIRMVKVIRHTYIYHHENRESVTNRLAEGKDPDRINRPL